MVDVVIPVYRPDEKLEKLIGRLRTQTVLPEHIFFMQTMADDARENQRVRKILDKAERGLVVPIVKSSFDHGGTRNQAAEMSKADFILFLTQDVVPVDDFLVASMLKQMEKETVAAVYGRQIADRNAGVVEGYTRQFNYPEESFCKSKKDLGRLGIKTYFCSNACAMYRRTVYEELGGFVRRTIFNEDMIFAAGVIRAGYEIAYAADAKVVHSHKYSYRQQFRRNFDLAVSQRQYHEIFDGVKSESEGIRLVKNSAKYLCSKGKWYLIPDLIFQSGFKFLGYRFGKKYDRLPKKLVRRLSMNRAYWDQ